MKKVIVIGSCGAGKSSFAKRLREITGLQTIHLDRHYWRPGWIEPTKDEWRGQVEKLLQGESWIIDGNYGGTIELRLAACDTAIFLDFPRLVCTWRVFKRILRYYGVDRPDLAAGCPERFDWEFIKWTWNYPVRSRESVIRRLASVADRVRIVKLTTDREVEAFLASLDQNDI